MVERRVINRYLAMLSIALLSLLLVVGCAKRRTLSDSELAMVFHDAFLANAYTTNEHINLDSLKLYEPIFHKYGYTIEDVQYTIGSFSTRKSARLSDVVEQSILMLEREGKVLDYEVTVLDTINAMAVRRATPIVYEDSLIVATKLRDTVDLRVEIESPVAGTYRIEFDYLIDTLDTTPKGHRTVRWVDTKRVDKTSGEETIEQKSRNSSSLTKGRVASSDNAIFVGTDAERLVFVLAEPIVAEGEPNIKIKNLKIKLVPPTNLALDSLYRELLSIRIFNDELLLKPKKDSI